MNTYSQGTDTWKQATKNITVSGYNPAAAEVTISGDYQITAKGAKIDIPTRQDFLRDLKKTTQRRKRA